MSALSIQPTYPIFTDIDGQPLEAGYVWIGQANLDPQVNPINVYWDAALTISATQPIRTLDGYPSNNGTPGRLYVGSDYSIRVMNKNGSVVYSAPQATERISSDLVTYQPPFLGGVATTVQDKLAQTVSVKDFGAVGDGVTDDLAAFNAAFAAATTIYMPAGTYLISSRLTVPSNKNFFGAGSASIIRANFAGTAVSLGIENPAGSGLPDVRSDGVIIEDFAISVGNFVTEGVRVAGIVKSSLSNITVTADAGFSPSFEAFRVAGEVYSNRFDRIVVRSSNQVLSANGIGFHIGNAQNDWGSLFAATNDNVFYKCTSNGFGVGFYLDGCRGASLYSCNAEKGSEWGLKFGGGQANNSYQFWNENTKGVLFTSTALGNGSGGTTTDNGQFRGLLETPRFSINVRQETGILNLIENTLLQGTCDILAACENSTMKNVAISSGASIVNAGESSDLHVKYNGYNRQYRLYGAGPITQGLMLDALGSSSSITNVFSGKKLIFPAFGAKIQVNSIFEPDADNTYTLGSSANRWSVVYAGTGTINTSDAREKQQVRDLSEAERAVAVRCKSLLKAFKFNDAVESKGDAARIHFGVMAQDVAAAFDAEGLKAADYALFCYDEWEAELEVLNVDGSVIAPAREAGNRYGVRYEELLAFIIGAM